MMATEGNESGATGILPVLWTIAAGTRKRRPSVDREIAFNRLSLKTLARRQWHPCFGRSCGFTAQGTPPVTRLESSASTEDTEIALGVLESHLERFLDAWSSEGDPPRLADYIPDQDDCRRLALVELIKI